MELNRKNLTRIIYPVFFCCILLTLLVSRLMYPPDAPEPYSDIWETISGLGNTENNPVGYIFFQIALSLFGILIIPVLIYVHPRLMEIAKNKKTLVVLGSFFLALGSVGFILTGFIPDGTVTIPEFDKFHEITSGMGFLGVMFAAFFYFWPMVRSKQRINKKMLLAITLMW